MEAEVKAALKSAKAYKVRNEGERSSVEMIVAMLEDITHRLGLLDTYASDYDKTLRVRAAEDELRAAQNG